MKKITAPDRAVSGRWPTVVALFLIAVSVAGCGSSRLPGSPSDSAAQSSGAVSQPSGSASAGASSANKASAGSSSAPQSASAVPVEKAPPGDIPDNLAFVRYSNPAGTYSFTHPEGWAQKAHGTAVEFTDKLNGVAVDTVATTAKVTNVSDLRTSEIARLRSTVPAFELRGTATASLPSGTALRLTFRRNSEPDQVTGKVYRDEVQEYLVLGSGHVVRMDLYGPVGADNVDAYRTMAHSLKLR